MLTEKVLNLILDTVDPIGIVKEFSGHIPPPGYAFANGEAISRVDNPKLFIALGTTYGDGDGTTTFNLPDKRGRVGVGHDTMGTPEPAGRLTGFSTHGLDATILGATGGHERLDATADSASVDGGGAFSFYSGEDMNNVQPSIVLNYIIRLG